MGIAAILLSVLVAGCQSDEERAAELFAEAQGLMPAHAGPAAAKLQESIGLDPTRHEAHGLLAVARLQLGDAAAAKQAALAAIERHETAAYRETLGRAHVALGEPRDALAAYRRALRLDRELEQLQFEIARLHDELDEHAEAERGYRACMEADIRPVEARIGLAALLVGREERTESRRLLQEARERAGEEPPARIAELLAQLDALDREAAQAIAAQLQAGNSPFPDATEVGNEAALGALMGDEIGENFGFGGLGLQGTGAGGGMEGTIGLGNIGTIGHGGGGGGISDARSGPVSRVVPGRPTVRGSLAPEIVQRIVRRHVNQIRYCYEQQLAEHPTLEGRIALRIVIGPTGDVQTASATFEGNAPLGACVGRAARRWVFPPDGGGIVIADVPITVAPPVVD